MIARPAWPEEAVELRYAINITRGVVLADRLEWATSRRARRTGLLGRSSLPPGAALYLVPCPWVHTFGMAFPIDVAFLAGDGRVLAAQGGLAPNRLSRLVARARGALELPAGVLAASGTRPGDVVRFASAPPAP
jgi:uncharacterized membrane protein (UPF0127 family)